MSNLKKFKADFGNYIVWPDNIRLVRNKQTGEGHYVQSNETSPGFSQRYVAVFMTKDQSLYVAVAVNKKPDEPNNNWWRRVVENRISKLIANNGNMEPDDKGMTMVPINYSDLLSLDESVYNNIYGMLDETTLASAILELTLGQKKEAQQGESCRRVGKEITR